MWRCNLLSHFVILPFICDTMTEKRGWFQSFSRIFKMGRVILKVDRPLSVVLKLLNWSLLAFLSALSNFDSEKYSRKKIKILKLAVTPKLNFKLLFKKFYFLIFVYSAGIYRLKVNDFVLVSLLLTLNIFHTLFKCFYW